MPLEFAPECCDAQNYVALGEACAEHVTACWHGLRPIGAVLYFSLPFRLGLPAEWVIVQNALLVAAAAAIGFRAMTALSPNAKFGTRVGLAVAYSAPHLLFMGGTIANSLSDGPSAAVAMISMWTLVLATKRRTLWLYAVAGGSLGLSASLRVFYLYPALVAAGCLVLQSLGHGPTRRSAALFCAALAVPTLIQVTATHAHTHAWAFIDPASTAAGERLHFENDVYGYDTLLPSRGQFYSAPQCFRDSFTMGDAFRKHDWGEAACLIARRQWFYFGSYVSMGRSYLGSPEERHFSVLFLVANGLAAAVTVLWAMMRKDRRRTLLVPLIFFGSCLAEGSVIIPESRFLMAVHVALWVLAITACYGLGLRYFGKAGEDEVAVPDGEDPYPTASLPSLLTARLQRWWTTFRFRSILAPSVVAPVAAVAATLVVQGMTLGSDLLDEDLRHVYESQELPPFEFLMRPYGNHFCALFRLSVAALHWVFGVHAEGYFGVVLLTHLVHVILLYSIIRSLTESRAVSAVAAALWGSAPAFQGTLQWFAAYSHMLGVTALLLPLWELARAREERRPPTAWALVRMSVVLFLGSATELTGSLVAAFFPLAAFAFLPRRSAPLRTAAWLLPSALLSVFVVMRFTGEGNANVLAFMTWESTLTMFGELVAYGAGLLALGPFLTVGANDVTWLFGASCGAATVMGAVVLLPLLGAVVSRLVRGDWDERRVLLVAIGLAGFVYAAIAAGRSGLTFGHPLTWMATRDRYHYEATVGLVIAVAVSVAKLRPELEWPPARRLPLLLGALATTWLFAGFLAAKSTYLRGGGRQEWTHDWTDLTDISLRDLSRRASGHGVLYVRNDLFRPATLIYAMGTPHAAFPGIGAYWIAAHGVEPVDNRAFRFVEMDADLLKQIRAESVPEVGRMFVSPREVSDAGGQIRTLEADAPPEVMNYLLTSPDPLFAPNDHNRALRLRRSLREAAERPPEPLGPAPVVSGQPETPVLAESPANLTPEDAQREGIRKAIEQDPKAKEALRQAILNDPKALEALRRSLQHPNAP